MEISARNCFLPYVEEAMGTPTDRKTRYVRDDAPLKRRLNATIPLKFCLFDGVRYCSAYPGLLSLLPQLPQDSTPECYLEQLLPIVVAYMKPFGYHPSKSVGRLIDVYAAEQATDVTILHAQLLDYPMVSALKNPTRITLTESYFATRPASGIIYDNRLVSVAGVNQIKTKTTVRDLCVETVPDWRGYGYAKENTALLIDALLADGLFPLYRCHRDNHASVSVAQALHLVPIAVACHMVFEL